MENPHDKKGHKTLALALMQHWLAWVRIEFASMSVHLGADLQNILRFIIMLSNVCRKIDLRY